MDLLDFHDSLFYYMKENNPNFSNNVLGIVEIEGKIDETFVISALKKMVNKYPKFSKVIENQNGNLYWKSVKINYKNHYKIITKKKYDKKSHYKLIEKIVNRKLRKNIPKHVWYVINYPSRCFVITKFSHSYGDGDFMIQNVLKEIFGESNVKDIERKSSNTNSGNIIMKLWWGIYYFIVSLLSILYFLFFYKKEEIFDPPKKNCKAKFKEVYIFDLLFLKLKKNTLNVSMNDLLYSILLKSLKKYANKENVCLSSSSMMNLRKAGEKIKTANDFAFVMFSTNMGKGNIFEKIHRQMNYYKRSPIIPCITNVLKCLFHFSCPLVIKFINYVFNKNHFGYSNYDTKMENLYIDNKKVKSIENIVIPYKQDVFFSLVSYHNKLKLNMCYKEGILDEERFIKCVEEVISEL